MPAGEEAPLLGAPPLLATPSRWVRVIAYLSAFAEGYDVGVFAGVGVRAQAEMGLRSHEVGLLFGVLYFAMCLGALASGAVADGIGRIPALACVHCILVVSLATMTFAPGFWVLLTGRVGVGFGIGMGLAVESAYISETSPAELRGKYASGVELFLNVGILSGYLVNYALLGIANDWRVMLGIGACIPLLALALIALGVFPESPRYLYLRGNLEAAKAALARLIDPAEVQATVASWGKGEQKSGLCDAGEGIPGLVATPARRRMALAGVGAGVMQMLGGITVATNLASHLIALRFSHGEAFRATVVMGLWKTAAIVVAMFFVIDQWGRRPLLLLSAVATSVGAASVAGAFYYDLPLRFVEGSFALFCVAFSAGFGPVTYVYMPEVFDTPVRAAGISVALFAGRFLSGCLVSGVPIWVGDSAGRVAGVFLVLAALNLSFVGYIHAFCPETKQKRLEELEKVFL